MLQEFYDYQYDITPRDIFRTGIAALSLIEVGLIRRENT
jgi:hypothetical protein